MSNLFNKIKRTYVVGNLNNKPRYFTNLTDAQKEALALKDAGWMDVNIGYGNGGESLPEMFDKGAVVGPTRDDYVDHLMEKKSNNLKYEGDRLNGDLHDRLDWYADHPDAPRNATGMGPYVFDAENFNAPSPFDQRALKLRVEDAQDLKPFHFGTRDAEMQFAEDPDMYRDYLRRVTDPEYDKQQRQWTDKMNH